MTADGKPLDLSGLPVIHLPGSQGWEDAYEWAGQLEQRFPGQGAPDFAVACEYNDSGPTTEHQITALVMRREGYNDGENWIWHVTFDDGTTWVAEGGCDYTGWDCRSHLDWEPLAADATCPTCGKTWATS